MEHILQIIKDMPQLSEIKGSESSKMKATKRASDFTFMTLVPHPIKKVEDHYSHIWNDYESYLSYKNDCFVEETEMKKQEFRETLKSQENELKKSIADFRRDKYLVWKNSMSKFMKETVDFGYNSSLHIDCSKKYHLKMLRKITNERMPHFESLVISNISCLSGKCCTHLSMFLGENVPDDIESITFRQDLDSDPDRPWLESVYQYVFIAIFKAKTSFTIADHFIKQQQFTDLFEHGSHLTSLVFNCCRFDDFFIDMKFTRGIKYKIENLWLFGSAWANNADCIDSSKMQILIDVIESNKQLKNSLKEICVWDELFPKEIISTFMKRVKIKVVNGYEKHQKANNWE